MSLLHIDNDNFEKEVLKSEIPVLVDFWAIWCGPCNMLAPIIEELANELTDVKVCKVDVDANQELAMKYRIMSIPSLLVFKGGEVVNQSVGVIPKSAILELVGK